MFEREEKNETTRILLLLASSIAFAPQLAAGQEAGGGSAPADIIYAEGPEKTIAL